MPPGLAKKRNIPIFPQDDYVYYRIHLTNGSHIILTSLLLKGKLINEVNFKGIEFKKKVVVYPFL